MTDPTRITVPADGRTGACPFKLGDRVRRKNPPTNVDPKFWTGTVAVVPEEGHPIVRLGGHRLGEEIGVDLDGGGRMVVGSADDLELA